MVFSCGAVAVDTTARLYYSAADEPIAMARAALWHVLEGLTLQESGMGRCGGALSPGFSGSRLNEEPHHFLRPCDSAILRGVAPSDPYALTPPPNPSSIPRFGGFALSAAIIKAV